ncbi:MAG: hypothetical protein ACRDD7_05170 [Peptostreptococcaceae bacterium]
MTVNITYDVLQNFLRCNNHIKLYFRDNTNILDIFSNTRIILTLELNNNDIKQNSEIIYNSITNLDNITMYIPKIYIK